MARGPDRLDIFVRGADNQLWQKAWNGGWLTYFPLGGFLTSSPAVASWAPNRLDVFVRGSDNALYHKSWNGIEWSAYERLGGNLEGAPAAISRGPNLIDVFFRGRDNHLYQKSYDGSDVAEPRRPRRRTPFRHRGVLLGRGSA